MILYFADRHMNVLGQASTELPKVSTGQQAAMAVFTAVTQGILVAGLSNYVNQIIKQTQKPE